jgi:hypothetical protein
VPAVLSVLVAGAGMTAGEWSYLAVVLPAVPAQLQVPGR